MWIWIGLGLGWIFLRKRAGKPILPDFLSHAMSGDPFKNGAVLVPTPNGVVAIPADVPAIHPAVAASAGLLSPSATMNLAQALAASKTPVDTGSVTSALTSGAWAMMDPNAGAGPDYYVDSLGIPRSNSLGSRPWGTR
jgi:hypothetical protein